MAGLLAARVLADHFPQVTVVERDELPDGADARRGVPHGRQLHVLLARGRQSIEALFPGWGGDLLAAGAVLLQLPGDVQMLTPAGLVDRRAVGFEALSASRPLIEATVRRRLCALSGVTLVTGRQVTRLRADDRGVVGLVTRDRDGAEAEVDADLVVDASGRGSRAPAWLTELGYGTPRLILIDPQLAYATRTYRVPEGLTADWKAAMVLAQPPSSRIGGYLYPVEGGRWMLALMGAGGDHPPTDDAGFTAFARRLPHPLIAEAIADAEPLGPAVAHRGTTNRRWEFHRMQRWPERFVVLGDAVCAFNPVYGQGITTAALGVETLDECLRGQRRRFPEGGLDGLAARFQRRLARRNVLPWSVSTNQDTCFPAAGGARPGVAARLQYGFLDRVLAAATWDPAVADVDIRVYGMLDRPTALLRPHVLAAAARTSVTDRRERRPG
ncbi:2-polyprenyl-6-methoxyphenol hydroxylase-like oxidoreductase [Modestobacter muralis]|uniref:2-polyprenyl-6-methoxyphenol hydroxylase-like oxidoreductase n=2 Tax=Modestobacter muralis TaxID=1608614 RepID=A0A6P0H9F7_9ACTN|nr:2-polyprenyl-6-methoxyphenol hydroxylase-like oxidoreductase [Modestobacter muralis]NEK95474.1 2-polyprenyl-6-methoxyphenol hydroxylase-like oxidoreductase [Modestobacter muralis]NEN52362.1 2-polyprenyl-6-methoxyphenol hydroxylase-like oxidoreductase [Modestobacter muralis]